MQDLKQYIENNRDRFLEELFQLIRIPSISGEEKHKDDMWRASEKWKEMILEAGAYKAEVMKTRGHPVLFTQ